MQIQKKAQIGAKSEFTLTTMYSQRNDEHVTLDAAKGEMTFWWIQ